MKLGPGGIREIEFVAQALQLVRGGRDPELHGAADARRCSRSSAQRPCSRRTPRRSSARPTCSCATSSTGCSTSTTRSATTCRQDEEDRSARRAMCGLRELGGRSDAALEAHRAAVSRHFEAVFAESASRTAEPWPEHPRARGAAREPALRGAARRVEAPPRRARAGARAARPRATPDPEATLARGIDLVEAIATPRRLPRAARGAPAGARARGAHHRRLELGGGVPHAPPAAARRAARRPRALRRRRTSSPSATSLRVAARGARRATPSGA